MSHEVYHLFDDLGTIVVGPDHREIKVGKGYCIISEATYDHIIAQQELLIEVKKQIIKLLGYTSTPHDSMLNDLLEENVKVLVKLLECTRETKE